MPRLVLITDRLLLTTVRISSAKIILDYFYRNRDFLEHWEPKRAANFYTLQYQRELIREENRLMRSGQMLRFWIFKQSDSLKKSPIGSISINNIVGGSFQSCQIGYRLDAEETGKGYMTEALTHVSEFIFSKLNLHRIEVNIMPHNQASIRVAEKSGFHNEGASREYLLIDGKWEDHLHMVRINADWTHVL